MRRAGAFISVGAVAVALAASASAAKPPKPPPGSPQLTIAATAGRIVFGKTAVIAGQLKQAPVASQPVRLEQALAPSFRPFKTFADSTTNAAGAYLFSFKPAANARYDVTAPNAKPKLTSAQVTVNVAFGVSLKRSRSSVSRGGRVTLSGIVAPARNGSLVTIQKRTSTGWKDLVTTALVDAGGGRSKYSRKVRLSKTTRFRAVKHGDASNVTGSSAARRVSVD